MDSTRVVVAGQCTIDDIHLADGRFLPGTPGGAAAYAVLGVAMYGMPATLVTLLGDDYPFDRFRAGFGAEMSIDVEGVRRAGPRSIHNIAWYRQDGRRHFDVESWDVADAMTPTVADLPPELTANAVVLLTACALTDQLAIVRMLADRGCPVGFDTELHYFPTEDTQTQLRRLIGESTYFLPSIEHLQALYGSSSTDATSYAAHLCGLGCPWIVVKCGALGCTLIDADGGRSWRVPAVNNVSLMDPTGAGDGFDGGFMAAIADGKSPVDAACWGGVTASFVVESIGAVMPAHFTRQRALERFATVRAATYEVQHPYTLGGRDAHHG
jgi:sugar/nucleoside kinase (ribokinase family)